MKSEEIKALFAQFEQVSAEIEGVECWSARELQSLLGYSKWENFSKVIDKAKESCDNAGEKISNHFPDVRKMVKIGSGAEKEIDDILLTRYACYLIAQNGDSRKEQIAFAQNYFAVQTQTKRAEIINQILPQTVAEFKNKKLSQSVAGNNPYFQKVPLIERRTQLSRPLIPLFLANKGIRENWKWVALLLREILKNKGLMLKKFLDDSSNPALIPAVCQEVKSKKRLHNPRVPAIVECNLLSIRKSKHF